MNKIEKLNNNLDALEELVNNPRRWKGASLSYSSMKQAGYRIIIDELRESINEQ